MLSFTLDKITLDEIWLIPNSKVLDNSMFSLQALVLFVKLIQTEVEKIYRKSAQKY